MSVIKLESSEVMCYDLGWIYDYSVWLLSCKDVGICGNQQQANRDNDWNSLALQGERFLWNLLFNDPKPNHILELWSGKNFLLHFLGGRVGNDFVSL